VTENLLDPLTPRSAMGEPRSLYLSARSAAVHAAALGAVALAIGYPFGWLAAGIVFVVGALIWILGPDGRIDVTDDSIVFVPSVPIRPKQRVPRSALGPFDVKTVKKRMASTYTSVRADITRDGVRYRVAGVFPRKCIELSPIYALTRGGQNLAPERLAEFLQAHWSREP
jgi:hypothetical protein